MENKRTKILFIAEGATLAHVARPLKLARGLNRDRFEVHFARPEAFAWLTREDEFAIHSLYSQCSQEFARRLDSGRPLYDFSTLVRYVGEDSRLIDFVKPQVIVGDFRMSLSVSARLARVPYATICDAYWSPEAELHPMLPVLGAIRHVPLGVANRIFQLVAPFVFGIHARPMERLREKYGLPSLGGDLRRCYTDADLRLFANFRSLFPDTTTGPSAEFLGPVVWSPSDDPDLDRLFGSEPIIYVTMGSSGDPRALEKLLPVVAKTGMLVAVAGAGKDFTIEEPLFGSIRLFDFLPGDQMCRRADLVICNGGSPSTNQALSAGVPVLGICRNMDQFLNMRAVETFGAGLSMRSDRLDLNRLGSYIAKLLNDQAYRGQARKLQRTVNDEQSFSTRLEQLASRKTS